LLKVVRHILYNYSQGVREMKGTLQEILAIHPSALVSFGKYKAIAAASQRQSYLNVIEEQPSGMMSCTLYSYASEKAALDALEALGMPQGALWHNIEPD
jgi:hypothetical protein